MKLNSTKAFKTILTLALISGALVLVVYCAQSFISWVKTVPEDFAVVLKLVAGLVLTAMTLVLFGLYYEHKEKLASVPLIKGLEISYTTEQLLRRFSKYLWVIICLIALWTLVEYFHVLGVTSKSPAIVSIAFFLWGIAIIADYFSKGNIYLCSRCSVPAGGNDNPYRLLGLFVGVLFVFLAVFSYLG